MQTREFLSFGIADESYALPLLQVREYLRLPPITRLPGAPPFLRGVFNLRGTIIPLVDPREGLGLPQSPYDKFTVVIIAEAAGLAVGLIVDRVMNVLSLPTSQIEPPPAQLGKQGRGGLVAGLTRSEDSLLVLLDLDRMLTDEQMGILGGSSAA